MRTSKRVILLSGLLILSACGGNYGASRALRPSKAETPQLDSLQRLSNTSGAKTRISALRAQALRDTALSIGARSGLSWRANQINQALTKRESYLNRVFNFNAMLLEDNVLPPVLIEARRAMKITNEDAIRIAERTYEISQQARFVTSAPSWRDYLWLNYATPPSPDRSLLPRNTEERVVWRKYVQEGWQAGIQQANLIQTENLARLKRDFEGMIRYRSLLAQNMVSAPFVAKMDMGVTCGGSNLTVNDRILRITSFPSLQQNAQEWKTEITPHE